jgi:hypothetical protein
MLGVCVCVCVCACMRVCVCVRACAIHNSELSKNDHPSFTRHRQLFSCTVCSIRALNFILPWCLLEPHIY